MSENEILVAHEEAEANRHVRFRTMSQEETDAILSKTGLQSINLRLPTDVIEKLKNKAKKEGLKYQPYVRKLLIQHVNIDANEKDKLRADIRELIKEELDKRPSYKIKN